MKAAVAFAALAFSASASGQAGVTASPAQDRVTVSALADECVVPPVFNPPFTHIYRLKTGGTLIFVAVHHSRDGGDASHEQIRAAFDRYAPTVVLVEGTASSQTSPQAIKFLIDAADRQSRSGAIQENMFALKLAADRGTGFSGWDFSPDENYANSVAHGFEMTDVIGTHLIRDKVDPFASFAAGEMMDREMKYAARFRPTGPFDYAGWYRKHYGETFREAHGTPRGKGIGGRIAKYETYRRNVDLIAVIDRNAKAGAVILAEAGANHWLALKDYLRSISSKVD